MVQSVGKDGGSVGQQEHRAELGRVQGSRVAWAHGRGEAVPGQ